MYSNILYRKDIEKILSSIDKKTNSFFSLKNIVKRGGVDTPRQFFFSKNELFTKHESVIMEILLRHALQSEKAAPGSINDFFDQIGSKTVKKDQKFNRRATSKDFSEIEAFRSMNSHDSEMLKTAIDLVGFAGKIVIEKSKTQNASIELSDGYKFGVTSPFITKPVYFDDPVVITIDGYIESVAEIDKLLSECHETSARLLLCIRGATADVLNTLKVNFDRRTLNVIPVIVQFDVDGINSLNDIAVVVGGDVVSTNAGRLISSVSLSDSKSIERCTVYNDLLNIDNRLTMFAVKNHRAFLQKKMEKSETDIASLFAKRIKSLTSSKVIIRLPDDINLKARTEAFDVAIRSYARLVDVGVGSTAAPSHIVKSCVDSLKNLGTIIINS